MDPEDRDRRINTWADGGTLEREEASYYRKQAKAVRLKWPRTSAVLQRIAESYLAYAKEHDQDAERRQW